MKPELVNEYILKTKLRYKEPSDDTPKEIENELSKISLIPSNDFVFAATVVEFALILRDSVYKGNSSYEHILEILNDVSLLDDEYKLEFKSIVEKAQRIASLNEMYNDYY